MLSLLIPFFNAAAFLPRLLDSISPLPEDRVELLFVDDGSADDGPARVEAFIARRGNARLVRHQGNQGLGAASNTAIASARGEFLQRCDADDLSIPAGLLAALAQAERERLDLLIQPYIERKWDGREVRREPPPPLPGERYVDYYWRTWYGLLWAILIRTEVARRVRFREGIKLGTDDLWMAELSAEVDMARVGFAAEPAYLYVRRPGSASQATAERQAAHAEAKRIRLGHMEAIGRKHVAAGLLAEAVMQSAVVEHAGGRFLAALRKSGQYARAVDEFWRLRRTLGVSREMRYHFLRCLPGALWQRLRGAAPPA
jgi:glycosyltransferase involved in cell wall biosynthesis